MGKYKGPFEGLFHRDANSTIYWLKVCLRELCQHMPNIGTKVMIEGTISRIANMTSGQNEFVHDEIYEKMDSSRFELSQNNRNISAQRINTICKSIIMYTRY